MRRRWLLVLPLLLGGPAVAQERSRIRAYLEDHCLECHEGDGAKGGLDLAALPLGLSEPRTFATWVKVHDRVADGEMPPGKGARPPRAGTRAFLQALADPLVATDLAREAAEGRAVRRRLNRLEYENTLRDLFQAPWLQVKQTLPEDGQAHRFNKVGEALDVSHVQMAQYMAAAEAAMRQVLAAEAVRPEPRKVRYHARDMRSFAKRMFFDKFNRSPERATFPVLGYAPQPAVRAGTQPVTVGDADPATRELEGIGVVASSYEPLEPKFEKFRAPVTGRYRLRLSAQAVWVGAGKGPKWWVPDLDTVARGRRPEPVTLSAERPPRTQRRLATFDVGADPTVNQVEAWLLEGETILPDPGRLFRSRPPNYHNPLATHEGQPGLVYRWLEVEGPLLDEWPPAGRRLLFEDLPVEKQPDGTIVVTPTDAAADARRLIEGFLRRAYRRPVEPADVDRFAGVVTGALAQGASFADAMITGYTAVLCSPRFLYLDEAPGDLDALALASRLAYFLWNSPPDEQLRAAAEQGKLRRPGELRAQADRMLQDPRARRFVDAFLDYWLDLRRLDATSPDAELYPDYYLDDLLVESASEETRLFFSELLRGDLPVRHLVQSDFAMLNERLAAHYGLPAVAGAKLRRVSLPAGSVRGGLLTQAAVLKVTANGTTTSPVLRGAWIMERILGRPVPPPPPSVPAIEPDIRGARTIREQLDKHRTQKVCASCHAKIDPPGFALESFDVLGGFRERYRALGEGGHAPEGFGKNGQPFTFHLAQPVDAAGQLPSGQRFRDVNELRRLLARDERQLARNLTRQLLVFATGAPVRFGDRPRVEEILDRTAARHHGVRALVLAVVESPLFRSK